VASQPAGRPTRRAMEAEVVSDERHGWISHGLVALAISALGLGVAGSLPLTTNAQTTGTDDPPTVAVSLPLDSAAVAPAQPSKRHVRAMSAFARRDAAAGPSRSSALRQAITVEHAAQRDEELAKTAEEITRAANAANGDARQDHLTAAEKTNREAAAALAQDKLRRAVAARIAAGNERRTAESTDPGDQSGTVDTSTIPTGGAGVSPVPGAVIGAHFGQYGIWSRYHTGLDFRAGHGTPIRAVKAGVVLFAGNSGDWAGNHVAIRHADGRTTMSSHMSSMAVRGGQTVHAGQVIGYVGQTGRAFGAHLHFELYPVGVKYGDVYKAINPIPWLNAQGVRTN
jgi:murein DD-endopeptidase MepM/ murein hydrolase activator NlpD